MWQSSLFVVIYHFLRGRSLVVQVYDCLEEARARLEDQAVLAVVRHALVVTRKQPGSIRAWLLAITILQNPFIVNIVDAALYPA